MDTPVVEPGHPFWEFVAAVCTWWPSGVVPGAASRLVDAADRLLDADTWTPAVQAVADLPRSVPQGELADMVAPAVRELGLVWPGRAPHALGAADLLAGADIAALPLERLDLGLERVDDALQEPPFTAFTIDIDGVAINRGAAYGVGPRRTLEPLLDPTPRTVVMQIDDCCCPGCLDREVRVTRIDGLVCWEWIGRLQMRDDIPRGVARCDVFDAARHDAAIRGLLAAPGVQHPATGG